MIHQVGMDSPLQIPQLNAWDRIHAMVKGALGSIPVAGGVAGEFFNLIVKPPLVKKHERWMGMVVAELGDLAERCSSFNPQALVDNENFSTAMLCAAEAAMKTSDEFKLKALRNAVLNTALSPDRDVYVRETLLFLVNRLTSSHLMALDSFAAYQKKHKNIKESTTDPTIPTMPRAENFPTLASDIDLTNILVIDLIDLNLISMPKNLRYSSGSKPFWMNEFGHLGTSHLELTDLGAKLLAHVSNPSSDYGAALQGLATD